MERQLFRSGVGAALGLTAGLLFGAVSADRQGPFGPTVAAWVQGLGTVWAIVGASWIALRQSREAAAVRAHEERAKYLAGSRMVTIYRVMAQALVETLRQTTPELVSTHLGGLTRRRFGLALSNLRAFPIATLAQPEAVVWMVQALDAADLVKAWIEEVGDVCAHLRPQASTVLGDRLPHLERLAADRMSADRGLRDIADPGWQAWSADE